MISLITDMGVNLNDMKSQCGRIIKGNQTEVTKNV